MNRVVTFLAVVLCLKLFSFHALGQPKIQKRPSWVENVSFNKNVVRSANEQSAYYYLLFDEQEHLGLAESYVHRVYQITTNEGLQDMSDLSFDFDPAYQKLLLHCVNVYRNDEVINKLPLKLTTIQREESMDRYLYDGTLTSVINLTDIRVGDIVEYAFTRKGYNPVFDGHVNLKAYTRYNETYEKMFRKVIVPASMAVEVKMYGNNAEPNVIKDEDGTTYVWQSENITATDYDFSAPPWYNDQPYVQFTSFTNWNSVSKWATELFEVAAQDKTTLAQEVRDKFAFTSKEQYALDVVRFVQDEVRYLGFESGLHSHKPHEPLKVYRQRFGDCKDKSLLLISLLEAQGIRADPVLVHTSKGDNLGEELPSVLAFNHCVVIVYLDGKNILIDPTISNQGGDIFNLPFPRYGKGLIINEEINVLTTFPESVRSSTHEVMRYTLSSVGGSTKLHVKSIYEGADADAVRSQFARNSRSQMQTYYQDYYKEAFGEIDTVGALMMNDDRASNVITIEENYIIPSLWKPSEDKKNVLNAFFQSQSLLSYFGVDNYQKRNAPYALTYPVDHSHEIIIETPEDWTVTTDRSSIHTEYYTYDYTSSYRDREIRLTRKYQVHKPYIEPEDYERYVEDHRKAINTLNFQLTYDTNLAKAVENPLPATIGSIGLLIIAVAGVYWVHQNYDPQPYYPEAWGIRIGGWLMLPAFGLVISPLQLLAQFVKSPEEFNLENSFSWFVIENYPYAALIFFENAFHIFYFVSTIFIGIMFFQRRSATPLLMMILYASGLVFTLADACLLVLVLEDGKSHVNTLQIFGGLAKAAIWIPYFRMSTRVKKTFVTRRKRSGDGENMGSAIQVHENMTM